MWISLMNEGNIKISVTLLYLLVMISLYQVDTLSCLVERGVDISTKDNDGLKPVDLARDNNQEEAFKLLFRVMKSNLLVSTCPPEFAHTLDGYTGRA